MRAVEGPIAVVDCVVSDAESPCDRVAHCTTHLLWKQLSEAVAELLDSVTLKDLCDQARQLGQEVK